MPVIQSQLDPHSDSSPATATAIEHVQQLEQNLLNKAAEAKPKFDKRGQLLPRERL
jgi:geranyl-CoA carboxylase beta subunit